MSSVLFDSGMSNPSTMAPMNVCTRTVAVQMSGPHPMSLQLWASTDVSDTVAAPPSPAGEPPPRNRRSVADHCEQENVNGDRPIEIND